MLVITVLLLLLLYWNSIAWLVLLSVIMILVGLKVDNLVFFRNHRKTGSLASLLIVAFALKILTIGIILFFFLRNHWKTGSLASLLVVAFALKILITLILLTVFMLLDEFGNKYHTSLVRNITWFFYLC